MEKKRNGTEFLKTTSISTVLVLMLSMALCSLASGLRNGVIPIIMTTDTLAYISGQGHAPDSVDPQRVQDMVNATIAEFCGVIDDMPLAYECIFPRVTADTKILIKYNPLTPELTRKPLTEALKTGLTYMMNYTFPAENITIVGDEGTANSADTVLIDPTVILYDTTIFTFDSSGNPDTIIVSEETIIYAFDASGNPDTIEVATPTTPSDTIPGQNHKYVIKDVYAEADYIIYCPSAWGSDRGIGADLNLNLMTSSIEGVGGADMTKFYETAHDTIKPSLSLLNGHAVFNGDTGKTVLYLMDLLSYSGTAGPDDVQPGYRITATWNITVSDWKGIRFLKDTAGVLSEELELQALKICTLSAWPIIDLGPIVEGQMQEMHITTPWITGIATQGNVKIASRDIRVITNPARTVFSYPPAVGSPGVFLIFDARGREIWSRRESGNGTIIWNNKDNNGNSVSSGMYLYQLKSGEIKAQGTTTINR